MLTDKEIEIIRHDLQQKGIKMPGLANDLLDHLLCSTESYLNQGHSFSNAYRLASYDLCGDSEIHIIQEETISVLNEDRSLLKNLIVYCCILGLLITVFNTLSDGANPALILTCISLSIFFIHHSIFLYRKKNSARSNLLLFTILTALPATGIAIFLMHEFHGYALLGMASWCTLIVVISILVYSKAMRDVLSMDSTLVTFLHYTLKLTGIISLLWIPITLCLKLFRPEVHVLFFLDDFILLALSTFILSVGLQKLPDLKVYLRNNL